jgi:hypothetical protein
VKEPNITKAPVPCPPGWGWDIWASRCDLIGDAERASKAREMAERSRRVGRSLRADEVVEMPAPNLQPKGQLTLW